jgi:hypothetical protein
MDAEDLKIFFPQRQWIFPHLAAPPRIKIALTDMDGFPILP